jgi:hypothetical protein
MGCGGIGGDVMGFVEGRLLGLYNGVSCSGWKHKDTPGSIWLFDSIIRI